MPFQELQDEINHINGVLTKNGHTNNIKLPCWRNFTFFCARLVVTENKPNPLENIKALQFLREAEAEILKEIPEEKNSFEKLHSAFSPSSPFNLSCSG